MEGHVVLAHELEELHVVVDPPIFVVFLQQVSSDRDVADRSIKPHIENLLFELLDGHSHSPFQVTGDALRLEAHIGPCLCYGDRVLRPFSLLGGGIDPFFQFVLYLRKVDEEMHCGFHLRMVLADEAEIIDQLGWRVESLLALVALIASGIRELAEGAGADDEPVGQPKIAVWAVTLHHLLLRGLVLLVNVEEDLLGDLRVPLGAGPSEVIKSDIEPLIHIRVDLEVMIAYFLGSLLLLPRLHLSCSAVLICSANVEHVRALKLLESREDVGRQNAADDVSEMRDVVDIGQCRCDEDVIFVLGGQFGVGLVDYFLGLECLLVLFVDFNFFLVGFSILRVFLAGSWDLCLFLLGECLFLLLLGGQSFFQLSQLLLGEAHPLALRQRFGILLIALLLILSLLLDLLLLLLLPDLLFLLYLALHILKIIRIYKRNEQSYDSGIFQALVIWSFLMVFLGWLGQLQWDGDC